MAANIMVKPEEVWDLYLNERFDVRSTKILIAERMEFGIGIYLDIAPITPKVIVEIDDEEFYKDVLLSREDSKAAITRVYDDYLFNSVNTIINKTEVLSVSEQVDAIDERELELDDAVYEMMSIIVPDFEDIFDDTDKLYDMMKDLVCEFLYKEFKVSVYRPMYLEDEDGKDCYSEFPYEEMEMD